MLLTPGFDKKHFYEPLLKLEEKKMGGLTFRLQSLLGIDSK